MGEVRRVRDRVLDRDLAMKLLPPEIGGSAEARARFLAEARLTAKLQHPGIVPVHDCGAFPDGLLWFTMKLVLGRTLSAVIHDHHQPHEGPSPEARSRLIDVYARICEAVAYAHGEGVLHRDLKPDNVMIGAHGEALVMDWGIAKALPVYGAESPLEGPGRLRNKVLGTPSFMPPEQARGEIQELSPTCDVYALGAILYMILCGEPPYRGDPRAVRALVLAGPPEPLAARCKGPVSADLLAIATCAMARNPADRPRDAGALTALVLRFLDGAERRARARALVQRAREALPIIADLRARATAKREEATAGLAAIPAFAPEDEKARAWAIEDDARAMERAVSREETTWQETLRAALMEAPDLDDARDMLAEAHLAELIAAEEARDTERATRAASLLHEHGRGRFTDLLIGDGSLSLITDPARAEVWLFRYVERGRRLVEEPLGLLGHTPLDAVKLPRGSYVLVVRAPGYHEMRYPVYVGRGEHVRPIRPGSAAPAVIPLLREGALRDGEVYVPAGWFLSGGDPLASESFPRRRRWVDGLIVARHPVTRAEFQPFLDDMASRGDVVEMPGGAPFAADLGDHPISLVSWYEATAYAAWRAERTGLPLRLLGEEEREKAARGADGRFFPWGDQPETTWACMVSSRPGPASPAPVDAYPIDESPYGVRGLAGNVRDWCCERWTPEGASPTGDLVIVRPAPPGDTALRAIRGGAWSAAPPAMCRAAGRFAARPEERFRAVGMRLARGL